SISHASEVITMEDTPSKAIRTKKDSSIRRAFELIKEGKACGVVSAGNTGAMMAAGLFVSRTVPGIARPAIASLIPKIGDAKPTVLLDSGANVDCNASQLVQFAIMGALYAKAAIACEKPRVGVLSNGAELSKGNDMTRAAAHMLAEIPDVNFIGYVEGRDIPRDIADVIVCDGFVGNIVLKTMEGSVELVFDSIKDIVKKSWRAKIGMSLAKPSFKRLFKQKLDPSAYGGAPLLGLNEVAIVCHGSSNRRAIMNAIRVAATLESEQLLPHLCQALINLDAVQSGALDQGIWDELGNRFNPKKANRAAAGIAKENGAAPHLQDEDAEEHETKLGDVSNDEC
ncbi:MAG: phosphate acyltransferase PlsX, partial [Bdellovibrionales bacterium]|nr:phosphate acyltransferase PlsX [Bdellovibrionales bacterium]